MNLHIQTNLQDFRMVDQISFLDPTRIEGLTSLDGLPVAMAIESLAQLGALHARFLTEFEKHCFLLVIEQLYVGETNLPRESIALKGLLVGQSKRAFSYDVEATYQGTVFLGGRLIFGSIDYDHRFRRENLKPHYESIFACLTKDLPKSSH
jgi:hypothetical protein